MGNDLPKVLMLGWEFPPVINGGLGVACHDLSNALSEFADITMVIPKSSPDFKMKNVNLIGVNTMDISLLESYSRQTQFAFSTQEIPADLNPYYSESTASGNESIHSSREKTGDKQTRWDSFSIDNLYGGNVISKVYEYAEITSAFARSVNFDIIHAHDWMTMLAGIKIRQQSGKPLVMHIHSLEVDRSGTDSRGWVYELEKKGMECADLLIPVSHYTAASIREHYGISSRKIKVVHNGCNAVQPYRVKKKVKEKIVLFVGRLTRQKGPENFIDIAAKVLEKNRSVRFVMAGVGDYFKSLIEKSAYRRIGSRFHLTGFLNTEKLRHLFAISDVYCMPSVSEPFGLSAVEAAQFGIPCVISRQSGVAEVLSGSLRFDFWDVNKAADCILNLLSNPVLKEKVVQDAYHNLGSIDWKISARKVINAYSSLN